MSAVIKINTKRRPIKRKTVVGPVFRLRESYHLLLSIVVPGPYNWRVEPHIVHDPSGEVIYDKEGTIVEVSGNVVLAEHEGLEEIFYEGYKERAFPSYHIAPWGIALLLPPLEVRRPESDVEAALYGLDVWKVVEWARSKLVNRVRLAVER